jgi:signal transduction histidine kinase
VYSRGVNLRVATFGVALLALVSATAAEPVALTNVVAVRALSPQQAEQHFPVRLRGVVTYHNERRPLLFVQDATGGVYVHAPKSAGIARGQLVEVAGVTMPGRFAPCVGGPVRLTLLGVAPLPEPTRVTIDQLNDPRHHSQWIEVAGVVRSVRAEPLPSSKNHDVFVTIGSGAGRCTAVLISRLPGEAVPTGLIGATVRVRGVFGSLFTESRKLIGMRLLVSGVEDFVVEHPGPADWFSLPVQTVASLMQFEPERLADEMVRVQGVVTATVPGRGFYVQQEEAGLWVETVEPLQAQPGESVEAVGFVGQGDWNPVLQDAVARVTGQAVLPSAVPVGVSEAMSGRFDLRRVHMDALLVEASVRGQEPALVLQAGQRIFVGRLVEAAGFEDLKPNSWLRVTGICLNQRGQDLLRTLNPPWSTQPHPVSFQLLVTEVAVLRAPPWWTPMRLFAAIGVLAAVVLAALAWVVALRRQVATQTEIIGCQREREAVSEERGRIARELHDTLEQELMGVAIQLDAASAKFHETPPVAQQALESARALLKRTRAEARRSIMDLRTADVDLVTALRDSLRGVDFAVEGTPRRLPGQVELNLLRIGQEAVTNALKHAQAKQIRVRLEFGPAKVTLSVQDDGVGFDTGKATTLAGGHFGLLGMRERAERINGEFRLRSEPGQGTEIEVTV